MGLEGWGAGEHLGGDEGKDMMIRIYCMKITSFPVKNKRIYKLKTFSPSSTGKEEASRFL